MILPTLLLTSFTIATSPDVQIRCIDEAGTSPWVSEVIIELDWKADHPMAGLPGYRGTMELKGAAFENDSVKYNVHTAINFNTVSWSADTQSLKSSPDLFYSIGTKYPGQLTQRMVDQQERSANLICERIK